MTKDKLENATRSMIALYTVTDGVTQRTCSCKKSNVSKREGAYAYKRPDK